MEHVLQDAMKFRETGVSETGYRGFYSTIAENYHRLTKEQLRDIIKELDYAVSELTMTDGYNKIVETAVDELRKLNEEEY